MSKNFASIYANSADSSALNQSIFVKKQVTKTTMIAPTDSDFIYTKGGSEITFEQSTIKSPHKNDRHHASIIKERKTASFKLSTLINIDTNVSAGTSEIDTGLQALMESLIGSQNVSSGVIYSPTGTADFCMTILNNGDHFAEQLKGAFVQEGTFNLDGSSQASIDISGDGIEVYRAGIAKSVANNNGGNLITVTAGEENRFKVGAMVMIVESNGTTRSADTANGSPRIIQSIDTTGHTVTLDGAVLADADGSVNPVYLCYYEPTTPTAINDPQTGLVGSVTIDTLPNNNCVRSAKVSIKNNHEKMDYCYGSDVLSGNIYNPVGKFEVMANLEINMSAETLEFLNGLSDFNGNDIDLVLGDVASRYLKIELPKVVFKMPSISIPENGVVQLSLEGDALESSQGAKDEIAVKFL